MGGGGANKKLLAWGRSIAIVDRKWWMIGQEQQTAPSSPCLTTASNSYGCGKCPDLGVPNACEWLLVTHNDTILHGVEVRLHTISWSNTRQQGGTATERMDK